MGIERREVSHFKLTGTEGLPRDLKGEIIHGGKVPEEGMESAKVLRQGLAQHV